MATYNSLSALFSAIANAIRAKTGSAATMKPSDFPTAISGISAGNIGTATAERNSASSITFSGLNGKPKMFCVFLDSGDTGNFHSARYICAVIAYENITCGTYVQVGGSPNYWAYVYYNGSAYSWTYANGALTVTRSSSNYGDFINKTHRLVYVY